MLSNLSLTKSALKAAQNEGRVPPLHCTIYFLCLTLLKTHTQEYG